MLENINHAVQKQQDRNSVDIIPSKRQDVQVRVLDIYVVDTILVDNWLQILYMSRIGFFYL